MGKMGDNYVKAHFDFIDITERAAKTVDISVSKKKKLGVLKKSLENKAIEDLIEEFEKAIVASEGRQGQRDPSLALKTIQACYDKLHACLKLNSDLYKKLVADDDLGDDPKMRNGCSIFLNHLQMLRKQAKISLEQRTQALTKDMTDAAKDASKMKVCYLTIKKGIEETEASMKVFLAQPTEENLKRAFCSSTHCRSIGAGVTQYKQIVANNPALAHRLNDQAGDPVHLLTHINDMAQQKGISFWEKEFKMNQPGWERAAKVAAQDCLKQMQNWRGMVAAMKELAERPNG